LTNFVKIAVMSIAWACGTDDTTFQKLQCLPQKSWGRAYAPVQPGISGICCMCVHRFAVDLVVCVALGCDLFDCVYPTRTAVSHVKSLSYVPTWSL